MNRRQRGLITREKILEAAELALFEVGGCNTSLDDIARAADMALGTIYDHFPTKAALLHALLQRAALPLDPFTVPLHPACDAPLERLHVDLQSRLRDVLRVGTTRRIYSAQASASASLPVLIASRETMCEASRLAQLRIGAALGHARMAGEVSSALDLPGEASFIHASFTSYFHRSLLTDSSPNTDDAVGAVVRHALRHVATNP